MNLSYIRYFVELAHVQHYTNAARNLNITQPSLSHAISQLEEELGVMLFLKRMGAIRSSLHLAENSLHVQSVRLALLMRG